MGYPGGKNGAGVYQTIINQIPPHATYIELFAGSASIFRRKRPSRHAILIDAGFTPLPNWRGDPEVERIKGCAIDYLRKRRYVPGPIFTYADPPYVRSSRKSSRDIYDNEMTDDQHFELLTMLQRAPGSIMISGYASELYDSVLSDWRRVEFQAQTRRGMAIEVLWMNYPEPLILHDFQYLGDDFRDRERIKRKVRRMIDRLDREPSKDLCGILSAIAAREDLSSLFLEVSAASGYPNPLSIRK